jgi:hypothetical protein
MGIVFRFVVALFIVVAALSVAAQDVRSTILAVGSGSGQIGLLMAPNEECRGPATVAPASDGRLSVLDRVNHKIVLIGGRATEDIPLPSDLIEPVDIAATTRGYLVAGALGGVVLVDSTGAVLARTNVPHNPEAGTVRLVLTTSGFALEDLSGSRTPVNLERAQTGDLIVPGLAAAESYVQTNSSGNQVSIGTNVLTGPLRLITITSRIRIVDVRVLWVMEGEGALVAVQESQQLPDDAAFVRLVYLDANGRPVSEAYLGPEAFACDIRRPFARLTDGRVVSLAFQGRNGLSLNILSLEPVGTATPKALGQRSDASLISEEEDVLTALERLNGTPSISEIALSPISRGTILERARAALDIRWQMAPVNFSHTGVPNNCDPPRTIWHRPSRLDGLLGHEVKAIPYRWGGYVTTLDSFNARLGEGQLAGSDCTCRNGDCVYPGATGQDCSGFVSYAWQAGNYFTTASLPKPNISTAVRWIDLAPADIVNKAGSHVRLVESISSGPRGRIVTVIESTTKQVCGGVCRSSYLESELQQMGYKPLRRLALTN